MIEGLSHITFVVQDLERTTELFVSVFEAEEVYSSGDRTYSLSKEKFFMIGGVWIAIMEGDPHSGPTYDHVAFKVPDEALDGYESRIRALDLECRLGRSRIPGEGRSLYFHDYDNHLFELHSGTLTERLKAYAG